MAATVSSERVPPHMAVPPGIELRPSVVDPSALGAWSTMPIQQGGMYGPYTGIITKEDEKTEVDFRFAWEIYDNSTSKLMYVINATNPKDGCWMRYVNCARFFEEQNFVSVQEGRDIFYRAIKDIAAGVELLTWFDAAALQSKFFKKGVANTAESPGKKPLGRTKSLSSPVGPKASGRSKIISGLGSPKLTIPKKSPSKKINAGLNTDQETAPAVQNRKVSGKMVKSYSGSSLGNTTVDNGSQAGIEGPGISTRLRRPIKRALSDDYIDSRTLQFNWKNGDVKVIALRSRKDALTCSRPSSTIPVAKSKQHKVIVKATSKIKLGYQDKNENKGKARPSKEDLSAKRNKTCDEESQNICAVGSLQKKELIKPSKVVHSSCVGKRQTRIGGKILRQYQKRKPPPVTSCLQAVRKVKLGTQCFYRFEIQDCHKHRVESGEVLYKCTLCPGLIYQQSNSLKRHYLRTHIFCKYIAPFDLQQFSINSKTQLTKVVGNPDNSFVNELDFDELMHVDRIEKLLESSHDEAQLNNSTIDIGNGVCKKSLIDETIDFVVCEIKREEAMGVRHIGVENGFAAINNNEQMDIKSSIRKSLWPSLQMRSTTPVYFPGMYRCHRCERLLDYVEDLTSHLDEHMTESMETTHSCLPSRLRSKPFSCEKCSMHFTFKRNMMRHMLCMHHDIVPYTCSTCCQVFSTKNLLCRHKLSHNGKNIRTKCPHCALLFLRKIQAKKHVWNIHENEIQKCVLCNQTFFSLAAYELHSNSNHVMISDGFSTERVACDDSSEISNNDGNPDPMPMIPAVKRKYSRRVAGKKSKVVSVISENLDSNFQNANAECKAIDKAFPKFKTSRFGYTCVVCKKRFHIYAHMSRHHRMAHPDPETIPIYKKSLIASSNLRHRKEEVVNQTPLEWDMEYFAKVPANVKYNLDNNIDGKRQAIRRVRDIITIEGYTSIWDYNRVPPPDERLCKYNFQKGFCFDFKQYTHPVVSRGITTEMMAEYEAQQLAIREAAEALAMRKLIVPRKSKIAKAVQVVFNGKPPSSDCHVSDNNTVTVLDGASQTLSSNDLCKTSGVSSIDEHLVQSPVDAEKLNVNNDIQKAALLNHATHTNVCNCDSLTDLQSQSRHSNDAKVTDHCKCSVMKLSVGSDSETCTNCLQTCANCKQHIDSHADGKNDNINLHNKDTSSYNLHKNMSNVPPLCMQEKFEDTQEYKGRPSDIVVDVSDNTFIHHTQIYSTVADNTLIQNTGIALNIPADLVKVNAGKLEIAEVTTATKVNETSMLKSSTLIGTGPDNKLFQSTCHSCDTKLDSCKTMVKSNTLECSTEEYVESDNKLPVITVFNEHDSVSHVSGTRSRTARLHSESSEPPRLSPVYDIETQSPPTGLSQHMEEAPQLINEMDEAAFRNVETDKLSNVEEDVARQVMNESQVEVPSVCPTKQLSDKRSIVNSDKEAEILCKKSDKVTQISDRNQQQTYHSVPECQREKSNHVLKTINDSDLNNQHNQSKRLTVLGSAFSDSLSTGERWCEQTLQSVGDFTKIDQMSQVGTDLRKQIDDDSIKETDNSAVGNQSEKLSLHVSVSLETLTDGTDEIDKLTQIDQSKSSLENVTESDNQSEGLTQDSNILESVDKRTSHLKPEELEQNINLSYSSPNKQYQDQLEKNIDPQFTLSERSTTENMNGPVSTEMSEEGTHEEKGSAPDHSMEMKTYVKKTDLLTESLTTENKSKSCHQREVKRSSLERLIDRVRLRVQKDTYSKTDESFSATTESDIWSDMESINERSAVVSETIKVNGVTEVDSNGRLRVNDAGSIEPEIEASENIDSVFIIDVSMNPSLPMDNIENLVLEVINDIVSTISDKVEAEEVSKTVSCTDNHDVLTSVEDSVNGLNNRCLEGGNDKTTAMDKDTAIECQATHIDMCNLKSHGVVPDLTSHETLLPDLASYEPVLPDLTNHDIVIPKVSVRFTEIQDQSSHSVTASPELTSNEGVVTNSNQLVTNSTMVRDITPTETTVPNLTATEMVVPDVTSNETTVSNVTSNEIVVPDVTSNETTVPNLTSNETIVPDVTSTKTTVSELRVSGSPGIMPIKVEVPDLTTNEQMRPSLKADVERVKERCFGVTDRKRRSLLAYYNHEDSKLITGYLPQYYMPLEFVYAFEKARKESLLANDNIASDSFNETHGKTSNTDNVSVRQDEFHYHEIDRENLKSNQHHSQCKIDSENALHCMCKQVISGFSEKIKSELFANIKLIHRDMVLETPDDSRVFKCQRSDYTTSIPYEQTVLGAHGKIMYVCMACKIEYAEIYDLAYHQYKKHTSVECHHMEIEDGYGIREVHFPRVNVSGYYAGIEMYLFDPKAIVKGTFYYTCARCFRRFSEVKRLYTHIIECAPKPKIKPMSEKRKKALLLAQPQREHATESGDTIRRMYKGCRKRRVVTMAEPVIVAKSSIKTTPVNNYKNGHINNGNITDKSKAHAVLQETVDNDLATNKRKKSMELMYNPNNHRRRRETVELLEQHKCRGCCFKFSTISLLERHIKRDCTEQQKLRDTETIQKNLASTALTKARDVCRYCFRTFTYAKSLVNHYRHNYCTVRRTLAAANKLKLGDLQMEDKLEMETRRQGYILSPIKSPGKSKLNPATEKFEFSLSKDPERQNISSRFIVKKETGQTNYIDSTAEILANHVHLSPKVSPRKTLVKKVKISPSCSPIASPSKRPSHAVTINQNLSPLKRIKVETDVSVVDKKQVAAELKRTPGGTRAKVVSPIKSPKESLHGRGKSLLAPGASLKESPTKQHTGEPSPFKMPSEIPPFRKTKHLKHSDLGVKRTRAKSLSPTETGTMKSVGTKRSASVSPRKSTNMKSIDGGQNAKCGHSSPRNQSAKSAAIISNRPGRPAATRPACKMPAGFVRRLTRSHSPKTQIMLRSSVRSELPVTKHAQRVLNFSRDTSKRDETVKPQSLDGNSEDKCLNAPASQSSVRSRSLSPQCDIKAKEIQAAATLNTPTPTKNIPEKQRQNKYNKRKSDRLSNEPCEDVSPLANQKGNVLILKKVSKSEERNSLVQVSSVTENDDILPKKVSRVAVSGAAFPVPKRKYVRKQVPQAGKMTSSIGNPSNDDLYNKPHRNRDVVLKKIKLSNEKACPTHRAISSKVENVPQSFAKQKIKTITTLGRQKRKYVRKQKADIVQNKGKTSTVPDTTENLRSDDKHTVMLVNQGSNADNWSDDTTNSTAYEDVNRKDTKQVAKALSILGRKKTKIDPAKMLDVVHSKPKINTAMDGQTIGSVRENDESSKPVTNTEHGVKRKYVRKKFSNTTAVMQNDAVMEDAEVSRYPEHTSLIRTKHEKKTDLTGTVTQSNAVIDDVITVSMNEAEGSGKTVTKTEYKQLHLVKINSEKKIMRIKRKYVRKKLPNTTEIVHKKDNTTVDDVIIASQNEAGSSSKTVKNVECRNIKPVKRGLKETIDNKIMRVKRKYVRKNLPNTAEIANQKDNTTVDDVIIASVTDVEDSSKTVKNVKCRNIKLLKNFETSMGNKITRVKRKYVRKKLPNTAETMHQRDNSAGAAVNIGSMNETEDSSKTMKNSEYMKMKLIKEPAKKKLGNGIVRVKRKYVRKETTGNEIMRVKRKYVRKETTGNGIMRVKRKYVRKETTSNGIMRVKRKYIRKNLPKTAELEQNDTLRNVAEISCYPDKCNLLTNENGKQCDVNVALSQSDQMLKKTSPTLAACKTHEKQQPVTEKASKVSTKSNVSEKAGKVSTKSNLNLLATPTPLAKANDCSSIITPERKDFPAKESPTKSRTASNSDASSIFRSSSKVQKLRSLLNKHGTISSHGNDDHMVEGGQTKADSENTKTPMRRNLLKTNSSVYKDSKESDLRKITPRKSSPIKTKLVAHGVVKTERVYSNEKTGEISTHNAQLIASSTGAQVVIVSPSTLSVSDVGRGRSPVRRLEENDSPQVNFRSIVSDYTRIRSPSRSPVSSVKRVVKSPVRNINVSTPISPILASSNTGQDIQLSKAQSLLTGSTVIIKTSCIKRKHDHDVSSGSSDFVSEMKQLRKSSPRWSSISPSGNVCMGKPPFSGESSTIARVTILDKNTVSSLSDFKLNTCSGGLVSEYTDGTFPSVSNDLLDPDNVPCVVSKMSPKTSVRSSPVIPSAVSNGHNVPTVTSSATPTTDNITSDLLDHSYTVSAYADSEDINMTPV